MFEIKRYRINLIERALLPPNRLEVESTHGVVLANEAHGLEYFVLGSIKIDCIATTFETAEVVHVYVASWNHLVVECVQHIPCGHEKIAVHTQEGDVLNWRHWAGLVKPPCSCKYNKQ